MPEPHRLLEQPMRRRLLDLIASRPGIHGSELSRESGEPWGTVQYHLSLLHKSALVHTLETGRERRYFLPELEPSRARLLALMNQGRRPEVAQFIRDNPGARQIDVCEALDVSRKTFRGAVQPLVAEHLVQERRGLQNTRYFPLDGLSRLLEETVPVGPASPETVADPVGLA